jgi:hypothetical protein
MSISQYCTGTAQDPHSPRRTGTVNVNVDAESPRLVTNGWHLHYDRQLHQATERGHRPPFQRLISKSQVRETLNERGDGELRLESREWRAEAEVRSAAE